MTLLFDQNLSRRLPPLLEATFHDAQHVATHGLATSEDLAVWTFAGERGLTVVTKDTDFVSLALTLGPPPKVIVVALGNCTTTQVVGLLTAHSELIRRFESGPDALLVLGAARVSGRTEPPAGQQ